MTGKVLVYILLLSSLCLRAASLTSTQKRPHQGMRPKYQSDITPQPLGLSSRYAAFQQLQLYRHCLDLTLSHLCLSFQRRLLAPLLHLANSLWSLKTRVRMSPPPESRLGHPIHSASTGLITNSVLPILSSLRAKCHSCFVECFNF